MTDDWFDGGSPPHLAANGFRDAPNLAADPDSELLFVIVAAITLVDMNAAGLNAGLLLQLGDHRPQRVAVERVAMQGFGVQHKLAAFGLGRRGGDRYLAAELVRRPRFPFADALHLRGVQRIDLGAALPVILEAYPSRTANARRSAKRCSSLSLPAILRRMSRITRPSRVRRNLSARRARLNWWAWV